MVLFLSQGDDIFSPPVPWRKPVTVQVPQVCLLLLFLRMSFSFFNKIYLYFKNERTNIGWQTSHESLLLSPTYSLLWIHVLPFAVHRINLTAELAYTLKQTNKTNIGVKGYWLSVEWKSRKGLRDSYAVNFSILQMRKLGPIRTRCCSVTRRMHKSPLPLLFPL